MAPDWSNKELNSQKLGRERIGMASRQREKMGEKSRIKKKEKKRKRE